MLRFATTLAAVTAILACLASAGAVAVDALGRVGRGVPVLAQECGVNTFDRADFLTFLAISLLATVTVVFPAAYALEKRQCRGLAARVVLAAAVSAMFTAIPFVLRAYYGDPSIVQVRVPLVVTSLLIISLPVFVATLTMTEFVMPPNNKLQRTRGVASERADG